MNGFLVVSVAARPSRVVPLPCPPGQKDPLHTEGFQNV